MGRCYSLMSRASTSSSVTNHAIPPAHEVAVANDIDEIEVERARQQRCTGTERDGSELHPDLIEKPRIGELAGQHRRR